MSMISLIKPSIAAAARSIAVVASVAGLAGSWVKRSLARSRASQARFQTWNEWMNEAPADASGMATTPEARNRVTPPDPSDHPNQFPVTRGHDAALRSAPRNSSLDMLKLLVPSHGKFLPETQRDGPGLGAGQPNIS